MAKLHHFKKYYNNTEKAFLDIALINAEIYYFMQHVEVKEKGSSMYSFCNDLADAFLMIDWDTYHTSEEIDIFDSPTPSTDTQEQTSVVTRNNSNVACVIDLGTQTNGAKEGSIESKSCHPTSVQVYLK